MIPSGIWAVIRYSYDGLTFFRGMLGQEVVDRIAKEKEYFAYLKYFGTNPVVILGIVVIILSLILLHIFKRKDGIERKENCVKSFINHELYLFVLWLVIPLFVYSFSGSFMEWYGYICYIPFCVIVGALLGKALSVKGKMKWAAYVMLLLPIIGLGISIRQEVIMMRTLIWQNNTDIRVDLAALVEEHPEYRGSRIYIENSRNEYQPQNVWEQNCAADAYIIGDLRPVNGGVSLFVQEEDSILLISKDLFETYSNILAGRVILVDGNDYLIFNNEFYH